MAAALADGAKIIPIIGMPPITTNHPERYVDQIFEEVLKTFSRPDTLTTSLQDGRKGRRAEVQELNGWVVDVPNAHGKDAPMNRKVVEIAFDIEAGNRDYVPGNAHVLIEARKKSLSPF